MAQSFTVSTMNNKQDAALAYVANKQGKTVDQLVQSIFMRSLQQAINERDRDDAAVVGQKYVEANAAQQTQVKTALGL